MQKRCKSCSIELPRKRGQQFCPPCARQRNLDQLAAKRRAVGIIAIGDKTPCERCGVEMIKGKGYKQLCAECRVIQRKATIAKCNARPAYVEHRKRKEQLRPSRIYSPEATRVRLDREIRLRREEPRHRLNHRLSQLVRNKLKTGKGGKTWTSFVGYTLDDLAIHLERQFLRGMTWANMGEWHVDHIIPLSSFMFESPDDPDFRAAWALTNLRPLWATANLRKGATRTHLL